MDMCEVVIEHLESLTADELSVDLMRERMQSLEAERAALELDLKTARAKRKTEAANASQEQAYLTYRTYAVALHCETIRKALSILTPEQLRILDAFHIHPIPKAAAMLASEFDTNSRTINQQHHASLRRLAHALYGGVES